MKYALCFGINDYKGSNDLRGCVNDAQDWAEYFKGKGYDEVRVYVDAQVTSDNFLGSIAEIFGKAKAETKDQIVITYSGHGSRVPDMNGDEEDELDECICLYNRFVIDDELAALFDKCPSGVALTFISDSCHSGTVARDFEGGQGNRRKHPRYLPINFFTVASESKKRFGSPKRKRKGNRGQDIQAIPLRTSDHCLISGCKSTEYSYDAMIGSRANGAFSANALRVLRELGEDGEITYGGFAKKLAKYLPSASYPQCPQLECTVEKRNKIIFT
jgi:metacaspase-1